MHLKKKNLYYYALLLIFVAFTSSISNINGWCVDKSNGSTSAQIELSDCHSDLSVCVENDTLDIEVAHSNGNKNCQTCLDVTPAAYEVKLSDGSFDSLVFSPSCDRILPFQQHSDIETFAIASLNANVEIGKPLSHHTSQNLALQTVVLLI